MTGQTYLLIFFLIFFLIVFVIRSYLLWKSSGINPLTFDNSDDAHGFNGKVFKIISYFELAIVRSTLSKMIGINIICRFGT